MVLSYSGADFCGWQKQPGVPTVQEELENALYTLLGTPTPVVGAGRTDTEVSAAGYVLHFDAPSEPDTRWLRCKLNAILPRSIAVSSVSPAAEDFHARFGAVRREYTYFLHREKDPFAEGWSFLFSYAGLDFDLMNRAAALLVGTHDFSCFQKSGSDNKTTLCTVYEAAWHPYTPTHVSLFSPSPRCTPPCGAPAGGTCPPAARQVEPLPPDLSACSPTGGTPTPGTCPSAHGQVNQDFADSQVVGSGYWYFRIAADRFLRNMVRAVVGTLLEVGRGKRPLTAADARPGCTIAPFDTLLDGGPRTASGESAPGYALFLSRVDY